MEKSGIEIRTLKDAIDSGADLSGLCFESVVPITSQQDTRYRVVKKDERYLEVVPLGCKDNSERDSGESISILLWQHLNDETY